ncbi:YjfI family protein [Simiduia curdlanivorans]|uniref:YjfI family protein n=1 Tax=Simiduia curdlanivorans TaxID=1492769 RepID=A0ABV8V2X2_9GAMM|nr:YjfI family protein [Simiduia curdlanivorans]MDN3637709.1 YjfI family protein [Simiduia curdlanivorans]
MKPKSSAHYQREYRQRLREQGLVKKEVWILPKHSKLLLQYEKLLRLPGEVEMTKGEVFMQELHAWTTATLYAALQESDLFSEQRRASVELIDGVEPALHIVMKEYGDLPVFLTVVGEQIIVESLLWSVSEVKDTAAFNEMVLRTHKYFPLSTISLDNLGAEGDYYHMFGALSSASALQNIIFEIEVLASNVIQATEAYAEHLLN